MYGEQHLLSTRNSPSVQVSVWLMIAGALVAGAYDLEFSAAGYLLVLLNCVFTAAYLLYISKLGKSSGLNTFGLMFYNNIQSLPVVTALCWINGDLSAVASYPHLWQWDFVVCFVFQSALAFLLNYSIFLCTQLNSPLATSVTGQVKNVLTTALGYVTFGGASTNALNAIGVSLGVVASAWYSLLKFRESEAAKKQSVLPSASTPGGLSAQELARQQAHMRDSDDETEDEATSPSPTVSSHLIPPVAKGPMGFGLSSTLTTRG